MSTVTDIAHQVIDPLVVSYLDVQAMALALAERAADLGLVLTIERDRFHVGPAMGNYGLRVSVSPRRDNGGPYCVEHEVPCPEAEEKMLDLMTQHEKLRGRNVEGNDALVGRRRKWSSAR